MCVSPRCAHSRGGVRKTPLCGVRIGSEPAFAGGSLPVGCCIPSKSMTPVFGRCWLKTAIAHHLHSRDGMILAQNAQKRKSRFSAVPVLLAKLALAVMLALAALRDCLFLYAVVEFALLVTVVCCDRWI